MRMWKRLSRRGRRWFATFIITKCNSIWCNSFLFPFETNSIWFFARLFNITFFILLNRISSIYWILGCRTRPSRRRPQAERSATNSRGKWSLFAARLPAIWIPSRSWKVCPTVHIESTAYARPWTFWAARRWLHIDTKEWSPEEYSQTPSPMAAYGPENEGRI